jgi:phenylalanyl-tRNA synthetase beta chain
MSRELKHLRVGLLPGLISGAVRNLHQGVRDVRLVEAGKVFRAAGGPIGSERHEATLLLAGQPDEWDRPGTEADRSLELKGAVEALLEALGIDSWETATYHGAHWKHGTAARILAAGGPVAELGEISPALAERLGLDRPAWAAILDVASVGSAVPARRRYAEIPRFPASKRDLAVVVPREARHAELERVIRRLEVRSSKESGSSTSSKGGRSAREGRAWRTRSNSGPRNERCRIGTWTRR